MNVTPAQLQELIDELHQVNEELADAARPLHRLPYLNKDQRQLVRAQLNAGHTRWEDITGRIGRALELPTHDGPDDEAPRVIGDMRTSSTVRSA